MGRVRFRKCDESLHGKRFPLKMNSDVYRLRKLSNVVWKGDVVFNRK